MRMKRDADQVGIHEPSGKRHCGDHKTDKTMLSKFKEYAKKIDDKNAKRERLVKSSREVTSASKKVISMLHRSKDDGDFKTAETALANVRRIMATSIAPEVDSSSRYIFNRSISPGMQEYVEARTFLHFLKEGTLITLDGIKEEIDQECKKAGNDSAGIQMSEADYVLGVADLTGELMRQAVFKAGKGDDTGLQYIWQFLSDLLSRMQTLVGFASLIGRDFFPKLRVMKTSVSKVQKSCYELCVRKAEMVGKAKD